MNNDIVHDIYDQHEDSIPSYIDELDDLIELPVDEDE